jgi:hypothetical protein
MARFYPIARQVPSLTGNGNYGLNDAKGVCMAKDESHPHLRHWLTAATLLLLTCLIVPILAGFA